jgi:hypothetical protein
MALEKHTQNLQIYMKHFAAQTRNINSHRNSNNID